MYMYCNGYTATPFWVAAGYVQTWRRARDITSYALVCMGAGMMEHTFNYQLSYWLSSSFD